MEAESMSLTGYTVDPGNSAWIKLPGVPTGTAIKSFPGIDGTYKVNINAIKENDGQPTLELWIGGVLKSTFTYPLGTTTFEPFILDGPTLFIGSGSEIKLVGRDHNGAWARVDSISFTSVGTSIADFLRADIAAGPLLISLILVGVIGLALLGVVMFTRRKKVRQP